MREILGRRRVTRRGRRSAALTCATRWRWPVVPGAEPRERPARAARRLLPTSGTGRTDDAEMACSCGLPDCAVPGAHPFDPDLLAATTDARMVRWWWTRRPDAPVLLATGGRAPCALSLPLDAGLRALDAFEDLRVRTGPVLATPSRLVLLVRPYDLPELGELLHARDRVPSSLRFHGDGGYVPLPPTRLPAGPVRWLRAPERDEPWLPGVEGLLDVLVEASISAPDSGDRLAH
ncbi:MULTISPECIES: bifunctional DNA primase/polymerase [unclassified Streptomyces]|uniref:bifunctional DNA primase/polymerase n=1 Tax=unclassified Streptomyces TaxID=2593676 RepID=UPI0022B5FAB5|nr:MULTISPECIES: bifunctional DNA primase/polymerase [unclassified Streptomyces]MCZ7417585.1 bifunctional DNA primase/polymerase [Streptomyces sp. WMMC897]MCZ7432605.1 bifunctional DNA primase/polymerase [Streptomyces sp. WMMC1477]